jgi:flagellar assembly factor FliW
MTAAIAEQSAVTTVTFPVGLPGFGDARKFDAEHWGGGDSPYLVLRRTHGPGVQFVIVRAQLWFPGYRPEISDETLALVGLDDRAGVSLWVILTLGERAEDATANLLGPLVVNAGRGLAVQAVQPDRRWCPRTPLRAHRSPAPGR